MSPVLIKRTLVAGQAYAVSDVDRPRAGALAAAVNQEDGWKVMAGGVVVGEQLDQRRAVALMMRTAIKNSFKGWKR